MIHFRWTTWQTTKVNAFVGGSSWIRLRVRDFLWHGYRSGGGNKSLASLTKSRDNTVGNCSDVDATKTLIFRLPLQKSVQKLLRISANSCWRGKELTKFSRGKTAQKFLCVSKGSCCQAKLTQFF